MVKLFVLMVNVNYKGEMPSAMLCSAFLSTRKRSAAVDVLAKWLLPLRQGKIN